MQVNNSTSMYVYRHIHGIPFKTLFDKSLPRIASKSILITHGLEKANMLRRLYPHCTVVSQLHETKYPKHEKVCCNFHNTITSCTFLNFLGAVSNSGTWTRMCIYKSSTFKDNIIPLILFNIQYGQYLVILLI